MDKALLVYVPLKDVTARQDLDNELGPSRVTTTAELTGDGSGINDWETHGNGHYRNTELLGKEAWPPRLLYQISG